MLSSTTAKPHRRQSSRPNSASSSSVVTVKRAASLSSSRSGSRTPHSTVRASSPDSYSKAGALAGPADANQTLRVKETQSRPGSAGGAREGIATLNRWSQSTSSSKNSAQGPAQSQGHKKRTSFSRRLSLGGSPSFGPLRNFTTPQSPVTARNVLTKTRHSPKGDARERNSSVKSPLPFRPTLDTSIPSSTAKLSPSSASGTPITNEALNTPLSFSGFGDYFDQTLQQKSPNLRGAGGNVKRYSDAKKGSGTNIRGSQRASASLSDTRGKDKAQSKVQTASEGDPKRQGHSRNRYDPAKGSGEAEGGSSFSSSTRSDRDSTRKHRSPSQKTMLSKALQKANTAVLLDNAQNFEGAMESYEDACQLLQRVMQRSNGDDDRKKLEAIRTTYTNRIRELRSLDSTYQVAEGKALPDRPISNDSIDRDSLGSPGYDEDDNAIVGMATTTRIVNTSNGSSHLNGAVALKNRTSATPSRLLPSALEDSNRASSSPSKKRKSGKMLNVPMAPEYMPPPLSPRRPSGPSPDGLTSPTPQLPDKVKLDITDQSTSWLDTIDESGGSSGSSVHSRSSPLRVRRKRIRSRSVEEDTEAAFGAALDAAVEAAYDDGFEIADNTEAFGLKSDVYSQAKRDVGPDSERLRQVEPETAAAQISRAEVDETLGKAVKAGDIDYLDEEAEEEERLLEEMTKGYVMDDFEFDLQSMSALPRQSDSSSFSGKTWPSSTGSNNVTAGTSLTTLPESAEPNSTGPPPLPPPAGALPAPPLPNPKSSSSAMPAPPRPSSFASPSGPGVRDRRLSGQKAKELKIHTNATPVAQTNSNVRQEPAIVNVMTKPAPLPKDDVKPDLVSRPRPNIARAVTSQLTTPIEPMASNELPRPSATPKPTQVVVKGNVDILPSISPGRAITKVASAPEDLRKNASLTSLKSRTLTAATPELPDTSPGTPASGTWPQPIDPKRSLGVSAPSMPTPTAANIVATGLPTGGMYLFEDHLRSSEDPSTPNQATMVAPLPIEPCPESFLLRPFWLMRCLYQTLAHPRGGYLTSRLFVPRDVWRVKNVKLKGIEEKISSCDLLTAALLKLGKVDTLDADAVLEEMQSLEGVLDQVRASLTKKIGSEVGVHGASSLFKASGSADDGSNAEPTASKSSNVSGKSYLTGWRKLRSKSSGAGFATTVNSSVAREAGGKDTLSMSSLPMTPALASKPQKRNVSQIQCTGPHATYMAALARLFDAVQVLGKNE
ncbi:MAG: hypothetical protein Q9160_007072 [Pyrenula sp. 1 TL-2023]